MTALMNVEQWYDCNVFFINDQKNDLQHALDGSLGMQQ